VQYVITIVLCKLQKLLGSTKIFTEATHCNILPQLGPVENRELCCIPLQPACDAHDANSEGDQLIILQSDIGLCDLWSQTRKLCYRKLDRAMRPIGYSTLILFTNTSSILCADLTLNDRKTYIKRRVRILSGLKQTPGSWSNAWLPAIPYM